MLTAAGTVAGVGRAGAQGGPEAGAGAFQPNPEIPGAPAAPLVQPAGVAFVSIPAFAFQPINGFQLHLWAAPHEGAIYQSGGPLDYFAAPVHLPHGAQIVSVAFYLVSNTPALATVKLSSYEQATGAFYTIMLAGSTPNVPTIQSVIRQITPYPVNNAVQAYAVGWKPGAAATRTACTAPASDTRSAPRCRHGEVKRLRAVSASAANHCRSVWSGNEGAGERVILLRTPLVDACGGSSSLIRARRRARKRAGRRIAADRPSLRRAGAQAAASSAPAALISAGQVSRPSRR